MNPWDFTGERYIPGQGGYQMAYEHLHRYFFALRWAEGKRVLDVACGTGYGSSLLARRAREVWGIDLHESTVRCARRDWQRDNLFFLRGDATRLPFAGGSMELIVAMEVLEHIGNQEKLAEELARVCSPKGAVLISTPNRALYSDAREYRNPFHVRELYLADFADLLKRHFPCVQIAGQRIRAGSLMSCDAPASPCEVFIETAPGPEKPVEQDMYFVAVCSMDKLLDPVPMHSAYLDAADGLFQEEKLEIGKLNAEINELGAWAKNLQNGIAEKDRTIQDLQGRMKEEVEARDQVITNLQSKMQSEIAGRDQRILELLDLLRLKEKEFDERGLWALSLQEEVERLQAIRRNVLYKVLSRMGLLPR